MDWIETTGKTIDEAKEAALDELGVDEQDAEFEVVAEPKTGLFGRMRVEARVRARVRPTAPRPKDDRRDRKRKGRSERTTEPAAAGGAAVATVAAPVAEPEAPAAASAGRAAASNGGTRPPAAAAGPARRSGTTAKGPRRSAEDGHDERDDRVSNVDVPLEEQGEVAREFLAGLIQEFGLTAQVVATVGEEDTVDVDITGEGLGLLIGPKGATLLALQDLTRSAVQQKTSAGNGRIHVDVSGYRQKRSEALARFANEVAETVKSSGVRQALEPMSAVDRKVIHDALTDVEGVSTISEGEDARRRVVIVPTSA